VQRQLKPDSKVSIRLIGITQKIISIGSVLRANIAEKLNHFKFQNSLKLEFCFNFWQLKTG
jgi:hypothetical protein